VLVVSIRHPPQGSAPDRGGTRSGVVVLPGQFTTCRSDFVSRTALRRSR
jgi:hypothetical protein